MVTEIVTDSSGRTTKINVPFKDYSSFRKHNPEMMTEIVTIVWQNNENKSTGKATPNPDKQNEIGRNIVGRTTKINVPVRTATPARTTPEMMTEVVTDASGRTTKINVPVKTTPNTLTGTTMVTEIVTDSSGRTTKINVP
ncbi:hypothetical protein TNIN_333721 [Trichonephila inaurata madagascariensis]|uniref:Uncharacterized protein n=1 Tax=Trichonephila inaurata madagascariensis TaxID=2747483 RepID=A0A8X6MM50_9ARAC|nr:hypothetical protein TNIN_333721 [Trichonephila inaurata madagascariensis]